MSVGSVEAKIPFQPGLALGSVVRGDIIRKMEEYAEKQAKTEKEEKQIRSLEQGLKVVRGKIKELDERAEQKEDIDEYDPGAVNQSLKKLYLSQLRALKKRIQEVGKRIINAADSEDSSELPDFANLTTGIESPINFDQTVVAIDPRGFDSLTFNSQYIDVAESDQRTQEKMNQSSSANSASLKGSYSVFGGAEASYSWSSGAMKRVGEIKNQGMASKILLINALVTTRYVRCFKNRKFDQSKLQNLLGKIRNWNGEDAEDLGITTNKANRKCIYILTEAVMGGSFTAIVTFLKEDTLTRDVEDRASHSGSQLHTEANVNFGLVKAGGSFDRSSQSASESHSDRLASRGDVNVSIEFIAQGAIPQLARDKVVREALKYQNQNLREYHSSGSEGGKSVQARQAELQKATYEALSGAQQVAVQKQETSLHSAGSILKAYDDFCGEMVDDSSSGVPIGFNYAVLTEDDIKRELETVKKEEGTEKANAEAGSNDSGSALKAQDQGDQKKSV